MTSTITLSLISHTNVGKTTLARTLLQRDVGEVLDEAHVTDVSEAHDLIATGDARLRLWDTPGFGDSARLVRRLRREGTSVGWLLHHVWDRFTDRALHCSQQAVLNVRDEADVVLYLVNASEHPDDAGYVRHELDLLDWMKRPVLLVLNQTGDDSAGLEGGRELIRAWREFAARWPIVREVFALDAFTRCWVQEGVLLDRVRHVLPDADRVPMDALTRAWNERNLETFARSQSALVAYVAAAASDAEPLDGGSGSKKAAERALSKLARRLEEGKTDLLARLVELHGLTGDVVGEIAASLEDVTGHAEGEKPNTNLWALVGAAATGALGGLAADFLAGGLTFGGGAVVGAIAGFLGGKSAGKVYDLVRDKGESAVRWSPRFLHELLRDTLLRYLAVAHFGRGRGDFRDVEQPTWWRREVDRALEARSKELVAAVSAPPDREALAELVDEALRAVLCTRYPEAHGLLN